MERRPGSCVISTYLTEIEQDNNNTVSDPNSTKAEHESRHKFESLHRMNTTRSDEIEVQRIIPDSRPEACRMKSYPNDLPKVSVVIIFRDEWPSVLIRTVFSVLGNSKPDLLHEIVLVDDGSVDVTIIKQIDKYLASVKKVKLVRNPEPLGLMMARQNGIEATTSNYFVVMDSHLEVSKGWLEPLVARLLEENKLLLSSHVGTINNDTFEVSFAKDGNSKVIIYDPLTMLEIWADYKLAYKQQRNGSVEPIPVAAVQGMTIAMKKDFFMKLGGFDPGMKQWGAEQFELSIKTWMCGGQVEKIPCSKVAHLYR